MHYADDAVVDFSSMHDAHRFRRELEGRLKKFSLELQPEKTRFVEFGTFAHERRSRRGVGKPETFEFLGFTHICTKARSERILLNRHTSKARMRTALRKLREELMRRRHLSIEKQGKTLGRVVQGYLNDHAIPTNSPAIQRYRKQVVRHWQKALRRLGQQHCGVVLPRQVQRTSSSYPCGATAR